MPVLPRPVLRAVAAWALGFLLAGFAVPGRGQEEGVLPERHEPPVPVWTRKLDLALYSIAWMPDSRGFAVGGRNTIWLFRCPDFFEQAQLRSDAGAVSGLSWSADNRTLAAGGKDGVIRLWEDGNVVRKLVQGAWVLDVAWAPAGDVLAAVDASGLVRFWERGGAQQSSIQLDGNGLALDWSPDGRLLGVSTGQTGSKVVTIEAAQAQIRWQRQDVPDDYQAPFGYGLDEVNGIAFSPDGRSVATTHQDGRLVVWNADTGQKLRSTQVHGSGVSGARRVSWSPDGDWLCTGGEDGRVNLVPFPKMDYRVTLVDSSRPIWSVRFSPDGRYLAAVGDTGEVWVWQVPAIAVPEPEPEPVPPLAVAVPSPTPEELPPEPAPESSPSPAAVPEPPVAEDSPTPAPAVHAPHRRHAAITAKRSERAARPAPPERKRRWWFW